MKAIKVVAILAIAVSSITASAEHLVVNKLGSWGWRDNAGDITWLYKTDAHVALEFVRDTFVGLSEIFARPPTFSATPRVTEEPAASEAAPAVEEPEAPKASFRVAVRSEEEEDPCEAERRNGPFPELEEGEAGHLSECVLN